MFTAEVTDHLKYYVYRLIDPRNGETFYVGKGIGNRVFDHVKGEIKVEDDVMSGKLQRIREIRLAGFEVAHVIHRHGMDEKTSFEVEAAVIDAYPAVTNIMGGRYSDDRGVMHSKQIIECYQAREIEFRHKALMITINNSALEKDSVYDAVRYAWKLSPAKAKQVELVLALQRGLVVGVFVPEQWLEATPENFPGKEHRLGRWGFIGHEAPEYITQHYMRSRLPDVMRKRGMANPVKYHI